jgi:tetratricopeptide (TPR) repeat protein
MMGCMKPFLRVATLLSLLLPAVPGAYAQAPTHAQAPASARPAASAPAAAPSALNAELFYQLLVGELAARGSDPGAGFSLMLDAARKTNNPDLYQRAVQIALEGRAGESALQAARAWRQAQPTSRDANRYVLQLLLALNRVAESTDLLRTQIALTPAPERNAAIALVPRLYARASDKRLAASVAEQALGEALGRPETASSAWTAVGRMRLAAGDTAGALEAATRAQAAEPVSEGPALLALDLLAAGQAQAEALVRRYLEGSPQPEVRMAYARTLLDAQRQSDARAQLTAVTQAKPDLAEAWLVQGVLQVQEGQLDNGEASLNRYLALAQAGGASGERSRALAQAYLGLAQIAEKRGDLPQANAWLDRITNAQDLVATQNRRASILARQGRMDEARKLIRALPERSPVEARSKLLAETQLLRDHKQHQAAFDLLQEAARRQPPDAELMYEQATLADKLGRYDELERLLRAAIALKPDFHHAYNALGYSMAERNVNLPEAKTLILKALESAPGDPFITDSLGWVEFRLGNKAEAVRLLEQAYRGRPDAEIAAHLGEVLWSMGQRDRARAIWKEGLLLNRENETLQETLKRLRVKL